MLAGNGSMKKHDLQYTSILQIMQIMQIIVQTAEYVVSLYSFNATVYGNDSIQARLQK